MTTLKTIASQFQAWNDWKNDYNYYVPKFIIEASNKVDWKDWDGDVFWEYFERSSAQCISSLRQGYFTKEEQRKIKENWSEIAPLLKQIALVQDKMQIDVYERLARTLRKHTKQNRFAATNRLIAGLQPELLCTIVNEGKLDWMIYFLQTRIDNCSIQKGSNWFEKSNTVLNYFVSELDRTPTEIMTLPWQTYEFFKSGATIKSNDMSNKAIDMEEAIQLLLYKKQIILQGPPGTGKTKLAKELAQELTGIKSTTFMNSEYVNLVQFHPSYSYEDFVRGIVTQSEGDKIIYKNVNKTLGLFAHEALTNYLNSQKDEETLSYEKWVKSNFENFVEEIEKQLKSTPINLTDNVNILSTDEDAFRYKGKKGWSKLGNRMLFEDIIQAIVDENKTRKDLKNNTNLSGLAKWHASYYIRVVELFQSFIDERKLTYQKTDESKIPLKNYVLIIDEINRANLSSVLGELIYALEYRGEPVESMYNVDDKNLILPPNLYIIGTMNTADRSAGMIDYAIRRRFAFITVEARNLAEEGEANFDSDLYEKVAILFESNCSPEFNKEDVKLGHSYFIDKSNEPENPVGMDIRWKYEIQPILLEYVKDGILCGEYAGKPIKKHIEEWEV